MTSKNIVMPDLIRHPSVNDRGYVDLPREAVLNDTASPAEQRAFAKLLFIPAAIPVAFFAPEAALYAGIAALVSACGSPGEAGDPIMYLTATDSWEDAGKDVGTTDEGDSDVPVDGGWDGVTVTVDTGDILVAADDGMTVAEIADADAIEPQDIETDQGDSLIAADDGGMSKPDDGMTIADIIEPPDVPDVVLPQDGEPDLSETSEMKDVPDGVSDGVDSGDVLAAADDGEIVPDIAPDQGETVGIEDVPDVVVPEDVAADTAQPCVPSCIPVSKTVTCDEGSIDVPVDFFVKCATQFVCDGIGTSLVSVNLPDPTTQTTQSVTVDKCVSDILFGGCQAINGELSEYCGAVKIEMTPKPDLPPIVGNLTLTSPYPSGNGCFSATNTLTATWSGTDPENKTLTCNLSVTDAKTNKTVATVSVTQPAGPNMKATIPANTMPAFASDFGSNSYKLALSCQDPGGNTATTTTANPLPTHDKTILAYQFMDGAGKVVSDSGPKKLNGQIIGTAKWDAASGMILNGATYIKVPKDPAFSSINALSVVIVFTPANLSQTLFAPLLEVTNPAKTLRYAVDIKGKPRFVQTYGTSSYFAQYLATDTMELGINTLLAIQDGGGAQLNKLLNGKWVKVDSNAGYKGPAQSGPDGTVSIGCWYDGTHCYNGKIQKLVVLNRNILNTCN